MGELTRTPIPRPLPPGRATWGKGGTVWRSYDEVFDLALDGDSVLAATNGGLLRDGRPVPSPSGLRAIEGVSPIVVMLSDGRRFARMGEAWVPVTARTRARDLAHGLALDPGAAWPGSTPPPSHPYAALRRGETMFAGTSGGLYRLERGRWTRETLPSDLPLARPNGLAQVGDTFVLGGLGGLYVGHPGAWRKATDAAIRQVATIDGEIWAVHGDGALDKVDPANDRLYPDVLMGSARRPWTSCVGSDGKTVLFGGQGGWVERGGGSAFPVELRGDVVTAITGRPGVRFVGSQKNGLLRVRGKEKRAWNPGNGLKDPWVTALLPTPKGLIVGTARGGLFRLYGDRMTALESPTQRVSALGLWQGRVVVGGMDGAWLAQGDGWKRLPTQGEETTSIAPLGERLAITTAAGVFFVQGPLSPASSP